MSLTRLQDRIEKNTTGGEEETVIKRYGMWGTNVEIEKRGRYWFAVHPDKKELKFNTRDEAEIYLKGLIGR